MAKINTKSFEIFESIIARTDSTYSFDGETSVQCIRALLRVIRDIGLNPLKAEDIRKAMTILFNIEFLNMPDLESGCFILAPNHVSDFDALILGILHPKIRIVSKSEWTTNKRLKQFLDIHYDLYGLDRTSWQSLRALLADSIGYFNECDEVKHYLVFSQGTISDFNNNSAERISSIAHKVSDKTGAPIINGFVEQASLYHPTRIVFDRPMRLSTKDDFGKIWLERETSLQNALILPARRPKLSYKHANSNKPGDPFFVRIN